MWVNKVNWAYLAELARTLPFTKENLLQHISSNKNHWYKFVSTSAQKICFEDLPNKNLLDFTFYLDPGQQLRQQTTEQSVEPDPEEAVPLAVADLKAAEEPSKETTSEGHTLQETTMKRTESEILNDPNIWELSESETESEYETFMKRDDEEAKKKKAETQEQQMARYLVENAPTLTSGEADLGTKKVEAPQLSLKREQTLKSLCELCLLMCLRPDLLGQSIERNQVRRQLGGRHRIH